MEKFPFCKPQNYLKMEKKRVIKQAVGIDIGKDSFYACYKARHTDGSTTIKGTKEFDNTGKGINEFHQRCQKRDKTPECPVTFVMEATGITNTSHAAMAETFLAIL